MFHIEKVSRKIRLHVHVALGCTREHSESANFRTGISPWNRHILNVLHPIVSSGNDSRQPAQLFSQAFWAEELKVRRAETQLKSAVTFTIENMNLGPARGACFNVPSMEGERCFQPGDEA